MLHPKTLFQSPWAAYISQKLLLYWELVFTSVVSVSIICCYPNLREMWSHRKNADISMTFLLKVKTKKFFLPFFKIITELEKKGGKTFSDPSFCLLVSMMDNMPQCWLLSFHFLKHLMFPWYLPLLIYYRDT